MSAERSDWARRLLIAADVLRDVTPEDLRADQPFYDELVLVLTEYQLSDAAFRRVAPDVPNPPDWEALEAVVSASEPDALLLHIQGWITQARWFEAPLARVHQAGWLETALRRLSAQASALDIVAVKED